MSFIASAHPAMPAPDSSIHWEAFYTLSAKSLQSYVMAGGKLREMTGATLLIDELPQKLLEHALRLAGLTQNQDWWPVTQASGIARLLMANLSDARRMERLMPAIASEFSPGLEIVQAVVALGSRPYTEVSHDAELALIEARNFPPPALPAVSPPSTLNPRTGLPAIKTQHGGRLDWAAVRKRERRDAHRQAIFSGQFKSELAHTTYERFGFAESEQVARHFQHMASGNEDNQDNGLEALSGGERNFIAVLHADGNGVGEMFIRIGEALDAPEYKAKPLTEIASFYAALSAAIDAATAEALAVPMDKLLGDWEKARVDAQSKGQPPPPLPVWPIVAAGDDLSALFRADVALEFVESYITAFAVETKAAFDVVRSAFPWAVGFLPTHLTAGAGITMCKTHYPFRTAYALCESMAKHAKKTAKRDHDGAGSVTFHRLLGAAHVTEWDQLTDSALKGSDGIVLSQAPYFIGVDAKGDPVKEPTLRSLHELASAIKALPSGPVRQLLTHLRTSKTEAERQWQRMRQVADESEKQRAHWTQFCNALAKLTGKQPTSGFDVLLDSKQQTPFADALTLLETNPS